MRVEPIITVCSRNFGFIATLILSSTTCVVARKLPSGPETIAHSSRTNMLLFRVITPPSTGNFSIPSCICLIGHIISPLNPIKGVVAGINWFLISERIRLKQFSYKIFEADMPSTYMRCMQLPPISASMIIGPSVPSSSPKGKKDLWVRRKALCDPFPGHSFLRLDH
ncbi:hypothetical protein Tco_0486720 [Tanacetum coccineum]